MELRAYSSHVIGVPREEKTSQVALVTSGPIPSPGIKVTTFSEASPGRGTYVTRDWKVLCHIEECIESGSRSKNEERTGIRVCLWSREIADLNIFPILQIGVI